MDKSNNRRRAILIGLLWSAFYMVWIGNMLAEDVGSRAAMILLYGAKYLILLILLWLDCLVPAPKEEQAQTEKNESRRERWGYIAMTAVIIAIFIYELMKKCII